MQSFSSLFHTRFESWHVFQTRNTHQFSPVTFQVPDSHMCQVFVLLGNTELDDLNVPSHLDDF